MTTSKSKPATRTPPAKLAVVEIAEWYDGDRITSVKPMLQIFKQALGNEPADFLHSTFVDKKSLESTLEYYASKRGIQYICISCHGDEEFLYGLDENSISRTIVKNSLDRGKKGGVIGVYFGSCGFVETGARKIFEVKKEEKPKVRWVAGFSEYPDWIRSSALEMLFLEKVLRAKKGEEKDIEEVVEKLQAECGGLMKELGFHVFVKEHGNTTWGTMRDLVNPE